MNNTESKKMALTDLVTKLWSQRKLFYKVLPITFVVSCALILCVPRTYDSTVTLAPESSTSGMGGGLSSLVSSFGLDLNSATSSDAIYPSLYPDVIGSTQFRLSLLDVYLTGEDGQTRTYREIIRNERHPFWWYPGFWAKRMMSRIIAPKQVMSNDSTGTNTLIYLDRETGGMVKKLNKDIQCSVDMRTDVITINTTAQDPVIAAALADTIRVKLQEYIITYRTHKTQQDIAYYQNETDKAQAAYMKSVEKLSVFRDAHLETSLESVKIQGEYLEQEKDVNYTIFTSFQKQLLSAQAKLQERTPSFTVLEPAVVPYKATGPKRMVFVLVMLVLSGIVCSTWVLRKELKEWF